jgi:DNA-binding transcriptional LysR family regulator
MHWRQIDLNLLVIFDAIMREHSIKRAAEKLNMTQPAVSHALARLRTALQDELFVRTPDGMQPTPQAERLSPSVRQALADLRAALYGAEAFSPEQSERTFTLAINNYVTLVIAPKLVELVAREAPSITLDLRPIGAIDITESLDRGDIDLATGGFAAGAERFCDERLLDDDFACVLRQGHQAVRQDGTIEVEKLADLAYIEISSSGVGEGSNFVDNEFSRRGLERRIVLRAPLLAAAAILGQSDLIAVLPSRAARALAQTTALQVVPLPMVSPSIRISMLWHRRMDDSSAHRWLRDIVGRLAHSMSS